MKDEENKLTEEPIVTEEAVTADENGVIEKGMPKVKPDTNAAEILEYLAGK